MKKIMILLSVLCMILGTSIVYVNASEENIIEYETSRYALNNEAAMYIDNNNVLRAFELKDIYGNRPYGAKITILDTDVLSAAFCGSEIYYIKSDKTLWAFLKDVGYDISQKPVKIMEEVVKLQYTFYGEVNVIKTNEELWKITTEGGQVQPTKHMENVKDVMGSKYGNCNYILKTNGLLLKENTDTKKIDVIMNNIKKVDDGFAIDNNDDLWSWGNATAGITGQGVCYPQIDSSKDHLRYKYPKIIAKNVKSVHKIDYYGGGEQAYYISNNNELYAWGYFGSRLDYYNETEIDNKIMADGIFSHFDDYQIKSDEFKYGYTGWPYTYTHVLSPLKIASGNVKDLVLGDDYRDVSVLYLDENNNLHFEGGNYSRDPILTNITPKTLLQKVNTDKISEQKIYTDYPESLTNETDDIYDLAMKHTGTLIGERTLMDDFLTSYKYLVKPDHLFESITKHYIGEISGSNIIYQEYMDKIALDLCKSASNIYDISEKMESITISLKDDWKSFKKAMNLAKTVNEKILIVKKFKGLKIDKSDKEITKFLKEYEEAFEKYDKFVKKIDNSLEVWDLIQLNTNVASLNQDVVEDLIQTFPANSSITKSLKKIHKGLMSSSYNGTSVLGKYALDKTVEFFSDSLKEGFKEEVFAVLSGTGTSVTSFQMKIADFVLGKISDAIDAPSLDDTMNTTIYCSVNGQIYSELFYKRSEFMNSMSDKQLQKKIQIYKAMYGTMQQSFIDMLKSAMSMGKETDKNTTKILLEEIEKLDYNQYIKNCIREINKTQEFNYRIENNKAFIVGTKENNVSIKKNRGRSITMKGEVMVIPDEIDGYPIVGIDSDALKGNYSGLILGKNIEQLASDSLSSIAGLSYIETKDKLKVTNDIIIPASVQRIYTSSESFYNLTKDKCDTNQTFGSITGFNIVSNPLSLNYSTKSDYDSNGLKLEVINSFGEKKEITEGWIETVYLKNNIPILRIQLAEFSKEIPLNKLEEKINYTISYKDEYGNELFPQENKVEESFKNIILEAKNIPGYKAKTKSIEQVLLNDNQEVNFIYEPTKIFNKSIFILNVGDEDKLLEGSDGKIDIIDKDICSVINNKVIAKKGGVSEVAYIVNGELIDSCLVVVKQPINDLVIDADKYNLKVGESKKIEANVYPLDTTDDKNITYSSSDKSVVDITNDGTIQAKTVGKSNILLSTSTGINKVVEVEVGKGIPIIDKDYSFIGKTGEELSTISLPKNIVWNNKNELIKDGINEYNGIYTPDDTKNYGEVILTIKVEGKKTIKIDQSEVNENQEKRNDETNTNESKTKENIKQGVSETADYIDILFWGKVLVVTLLISLVLVRKIKSPKK